MKTKKKVIKKENRIIPKGGFKRKKDFIKFKRIYFIYGSEWVCYQDKKL